VSSASVGIAVRRGMLSGSSGGSVKPLGSSRNGTCRQAARGRAARRRLPPLGRLAVLCFVLGVTALYATVAAAQRPPASARPPVAVPPRAVLALWQPLRPNLSAPILKRAELRAAVKAYRLRRWSVSCAASAKALDRIEARAARLFYAPKREGADLDGIDRFLAKFLRGKAPLLEVVGELFVPAAAWRALVVDGCVRAKRPQIADRFLAHAALTRMGPRAQRLRSALALVRWQASRAQQPWLVAGQSGGARTWLLRAVGLPRGRRAHLLAKARKLALAHELPAVRTTALWIGKQP